MSSQFSVFLLIPVHDLVNKYIYIGVVSNNIAEFQAGEKHMKKKPYIYNQGGFTLIEIIAVMVIISVLAAVMNHKINALMSSSEHKAIQVGVSELNCRETLTWTNTKFSSDGWKDDNIVFAAMDTSLGASYRWAAGPTVGGGTLYFKNSMIVLTRTHSTNISAGRWQ